MRRMKLPTKATASKRGISIIMTPLIDVIFLLMIFFIMTLNFLVPEGVLENRLPDRADETTAERQKDWEVVRIHVARGKDRPQVYLEERMVSGLRDLLQNLNRLPRDVIVVIEPEQNVAYKHVIGVFNTCVKAKKTNISFTIPRGNRAEGEQNG
jgi:biopolymer transport protein ExbD